MEKDKTRHTNSLKLSGGFLSIRQHWESCFKYYDLLQSTEKSAKL